MIHSHTSTDTWLGGCGPLAAEHNDAVFPAELMGCISQSVCDMLSDYHTNVDDPRVMKVRTLSLLGPSPLRARRTASQEA